MKYKYLFLACTLLLCSCAQSESSLGDSVAEISQGTESSKVTDSHSSSVDSEPPLVLPHREKKPNEIVYYTAAEAKDIIQRSTDFSVSENFLCSVPRTMSHFSSFTLGYAPRQDNAGFYEDFLATFAYLFPNEKLHEDCLFYLGENSDVSYDENGQLLDTVKTVAEQYERIMSGEERVQLFFYSPHFPGKTSDAENNIFMEYTSPIGNDLSNFNKGIAADYYYESQGKENTKYLETWMADAYFPTVCTLSPDSDQAFKLLDGVTMPVADAVAFFEDYVNHMPFPDDPPLDVKVVRVDVLKCDEDAYCYFFATTKTLDGIPFDYLGQNTRYGGSDYSYVMGFGTMAVSDDVDQIYGVPRKQYLYDEVMHTEFISFEEALKKVEDKLSAQVTYEALNAEFVYCSKEVKDFSVAPEDYLQPTAASWKISLYNTNDDMVYVCFIDALDGENFRYYKRNPPSN